MTIRVTVDATNPGQFFACCGLLELADRLWPGAEGWFADGAFHIQGSGTLREVLSILIMDPPEEVTKLDNGLDVPALIAPLRFSFDGGASKSLTLDAWMTIGLVKNEVAAVANPPWNFWSGRQTSMRIWTALRAALAEQLDDSPCVCGEELFIHRVLLPGRFGFDPGAAWNALDVGFSPNEQGIEVESSPAVELLAAVGLQRFRPRLTQDRQSFFYATWGQAQPCSVAAAFAAGAVTVEPMARSHDSNSKGDASSKSAAKPLDPTRHYLGRVVSRGSYAALGISSPLREGEYRE